MKLEEVSSSGYKVFSGTDARDAVYGFAVKHLGIDGRGNDVWIGKVKSTNYINGKPVDGAVVIDASGWVMAIHRDGAALQAATHAIDTKRRGYGFSVNKERSWDIPNKLQIDDYVYSQDE